MLRIKDYIGQRFRDPALHEIDLVLHPDLEIAAIDGFDVRPYQASQQPAAEMAAAR